MLIELKILSPKFHREQQRTIAKRIKTAIFEATALQVALEKQKNDIDLLPSRLLAQAFDI